LEKDPLQKVSEKRNKLSEGKKLQSQTRNAAVVDALHPNTKDSKIAATACSIY
jgi:hypothetical protein